MTHVLYTAPTGRSVGLTTATLGLCRALDILGLRVNFCKPIEQHSQHGLGPERSNTLIRSMMNLNPPMPVEASLVQTLLSENRLDELLEHVVRVFQLAAQQADVVVVEGLVAQGDFMPASRLNAEIVKTLNAQVILVASPGKWSFKELSHTIEMSAQKYGGVQSDKVLGLILNKVNAGAPLSHQQSDELAEAENRQPLLSWSKDALLQNCAVLQTANFRLLGCIPWQDKLNALRTIDVASYLRAEIVHPGEILTRRVFHLEICARTIPHVCDVLKANQLLVTSGDRNDILTVAAMAAVNGVPLAGIVFTGDFKLDPRVLRLCAPALQTGLPLLSVPRNTYETAMQLAQITTEVPEDDVERIEAVMEYIASHLDIGWLKKQLQSNEQPRLSPAAFRYHLVQGAIAANKCIILPEGEEPRTLEAAIQCQQRSLARCVLLGREQEIQRLAAAKNLQLPAALQIIDPATVRENYVQRLVNRRRHKGVSALMAREMLADNTTLATMMLACEEADGLVAGALGSTANTIRPALQLIRTKEQAKLVSSIFFMCLPEQVCVYGDCAVNPNPNAEQLADIAIQSADSAAALGIVPKVAMISYSTGTSGSGSEVEKVAAATQLAQQLRPDLLIDGPLQYDAAAIEEVGRLKAPNSPVAGQATVFIFPDLNTGNTTYKAVQRSANVISIGPMLQGLRKPVNDLSRGASVQDIVFTIALTAMQAHASQIHS